MHYALEHSAVTLPAVLIRFLTLAVLFRLDSAKKWQAVFRFGLVWRFAVFRAGGGFGHPAAEHLEMA